MLSPVSDTADDRKRRQDPVHERLGTWQSWSKKLSFEREVVAKLIGRFESLKVRIHSYGMLAEGGSC